MTTFDTIFAERAARVMLDRFGESIVYEPLVGQPRTILAMVDRGPPAQPVEMQGVLADETTIEVLNHPTDGIPPAKIDTGGDFVRIAPWPGAEPVLLRVSLIAQQEDVGMVRLRLGA